MIEKKDFYLCKRRCKNYQSGGQTFKMQSIYWDKKNKKMYTKDTVFITDKEGNILIGSHGMKAKDDFSQYSLYSSFGEANSETMPDMKKINEELPLHRPYVRDQSGWTGYLLCSVY